MGTFALCSEEDVLSAAAAFWCVIKFHSGEFCWMEMAGRDSELTMEEKLRTINQSFLACFCHRHPEFSCFHTICNNCSPVPADLAERRHRCSPFRLGNRKDVGNFRRNILLRAWFLVFSVFDCIQKSSFNFILKGVCLCVPLYCGVTHL